MPSIKKVAEMAGVSVGTVSHVITGSVNVSEPLRLKVQAAIRNLEDSSLQIALVVASGNVLIGTLTDGDIRRGLLRGLDLNSPLDSVINREPLVVPPQLGRDTVLQLMQVNKLHQLPVVDESRCVVGLHVWDELLAPRQRKLRIRAAEHGKAIPFVVRLDGTNDEEGRKLLREAALPNVHPAATMDEAAAKVVALAAGREVEAPA